MSAITSSLFHCDDFPAMCINGIEHRLTVTTEQISGFQSTFCRRGHLSVGEFS
jgi:hypothetical protein